MGEVEAVPKRSRIAPSQGADSLLTAGAVGVIAYVGETLGHEVLGHGGVCLLSGGQVTALAPLWMRCSVQSMPMVAAGPTMNLLLAVLFGVLVTVRSKADTLTFFFWLSCAFNLLVACGYMAIGAVTGFGDWGVLFTAVHPAWAWRAPALAFGAFGYLAGLRMLGLLYVHSFGAAGLESGRLAARLLAAGGAAAVVAISAELVSGHAQPLSLALAAGCTIFVGWSLMSIDKAGATDNRTTARPLLLLRRDPGWIASAMIVATGFIAVVGRGGA